MWILPRDRVGAVRDIFDEINEGHVAVVGGTDELFDPRIVGIGAEVDFEITQDF